MLQASLFWLPLSVMSVGLALYVVRGWGLLIAYAGLSLLVSLGFTSRALGMAFIPEWVHLALPYVPGCCLLAMAAILFWPIRKS